MQHRWQLLMMLRLREDARLQEEDCEQRLLRLRPNLQLPLQRGEGPQREAQLWVLQTLLELTKSSLWFPCCSNKFCLRRP